MAEARVEAVPGSDLSSVPGTSGGLPAMALAASTVGASEGDEPDDLPTVVHEAGAQTGAGSLPAMADNQSRRSRATNREFDVETEPLKVADLAPPTFRAAAARRSVERANGGRPPSGMPEADSTNELDPGRVNLTEEAVVREAERLALVATHRNEDAQVAARTAERKAQIAVMAAEASKVANAAVEMLSTSGLVAAGERLQGAWRIEADIKNGRLPRRIPSLARPGILRGYEPAAFSTSRGLPSARVPTMPPGMVPQPRRPMPAEGETDRAAFPPLQSRARSASRLFVSALAVALVVLLAVAARYARLI